MSWLGRWLGCFLVSSCFALTASAKSFVYLSLAADKKIAVYQISGPDGKLTHVADQPCEGEPGALITDPAKKFLFASLRAEGKISAFQIDQKTGKLTALNTVEAGADPAHISTDATGKFLLCAYYVAAKVTLNTIGADGKLSEKPIQTLPTADKAHAILTDATNRYAFVPHTGSNVIFQFAFDASTGKLTPAKPAKLETGAKTGPRHIVFHPKGTTAYIDNEQGGSVTVYQLDLKTGTLTPGQTISTLPKDYSGVIACSEIRLHPSGKFLYVANRGHDSLASFQIGADTKLTPIEHTKTEQNPRSFDIEPMGKFLYAAGESSGKLATYQIDQATGKLTHLSAFPVGKMPWWILTLFLED